MLSPVGFGPAQRATSGAALLMSKGAQALASNPAEVASLRGLAVFASGDFSVVSTKLQQGSTRRFLARPQVAAAWRLPEGFAVGLGWGRGEVVAASAPSAPSTTTAAALTPIALHRLLGTLSWEWTPQFRLGAQLQWATTESAPWRFGEESWKGGRGAIATRAGITVELSPKRCALALVWEEGLSLRPKLQKKEGPKGPLPQLKTPHSLALAAWVGSPGGGLGSFEFEADLVYGWQRSFADAQGKVQATEDTYGLRAGMGLWLTPLLQLRLGGAVFVHSVPQRPSWLQPMDAWSGSLSAGALWRYGPLRVEMAWQMVAGFESSTRPSPLVKQRISNLLSMGVGWSFD